MERSDSISRLLPDGLTTFSSRQVTQEEAQSRARLVISGVSPLVVGIYYLLNGGDSGLITAVTISLAYFLFSASYCWFIRHYPHAFPPRKVLMLFADTSVIALCTYLMGIMGLIFYPLYLWVAVAYRLRYGEQFLLLGSGVTSAAFFIASYNSEIWLLFQGLTLSLVLGLLVFSFLFHTMLKKSEVAINELSGKVEENKFLTTHDTLTGLANRSFIEDMLDYAIANAVRGDSNLSVVFIDVDGFSKINDALGTKVGDELLKNITRRLQECIWEIDVLGRIGSDDFLIIVNSGKNEDITPLLQRITNTVSGGYTIDEHELDVTLSIGITRYPNDGETPQSLIVNADTAMRSAKKNGGTAIQYYDRAMTEWMKEDMLLKNELRTAIREKQFQLYYQPQVSLITGEIVGVEALIRWIHPEKGLIPPDSFIPVAETSGLITEIGGWVLRSAVMQIKEWHDKGYGPITVAVNLSAYQLRDPNLSEEIVELVTETGVDSRYLELEVTESMLMDNSELASDVLNALSKSGFQLAMDDFGTGYSSLAYLQRFPFDKLKIDREFVSGVTKSTQTAAIVNSILAMGRNLQMRVIAEGVEHEAEAQYLRRNLCDEIQGYMISKPVAASEVEKLLQIQGAVWEGYLKHNNESVVLLLDDDPIALTAINGMLSNQGYTVMSTSDVSEAFKIMAQHHVSVVVSDYQMPEMNGVEFLSRAKKIYPETVRILLTGKDDAEVVREAINLGAVYKFLSKSTPAKELCSTISEAMKAHVAVTS